MRAVLVHVDEKELEKRRRLGLDRFDEMWEGVLHMTPAPSYEHQRIVTKLTAYLSNLAERKKRGTVAVQINVLAEDANYRIPDLTFIAAGREKIIDRAGTRGGGPDAVIEVRSPEDETYDKLPFYAALGVREVIVIDRDTKKAEIFRLAGRQFVALATDREGWLCSELLAVRFRAASGPRVVLEDSEEPSARIEI